jgi:valyl-tRNA synthetase
MKLLHPMMPFVSEELYQILPAFEGKAKSITRAAYPVALDENN